MKPKKTYQKNDKVLVKSFTANDVQVTLKKRYIALQSEHKLGVDGWDAQITLKNRRLGVQVPLPAPFT